MQNEEFIAAEARDHVAGADVGLHRAGDRQEVPVAGVVTVAVVDILQRVAVDDEQRERTAAALGTLDLLVESGPEVTAVVHAGELVGDGQAPYRLVRGRGGDRE